MEKTASIIFALGTIGMVAILLSVPFYTLHWFQCIQIVIVCMGMECCSLLPIIIETENKDYTYEL